MLVVSCPFKDMAGRINNPIIKKNKVLMMLNNFNVYSN